MKSLLLIPKVRMELKRLRQNLMLKLYNLILVGPARKEKLGTRELAVQAQMGFYHGCR